MHFWHFGFRVYSVSFFIPMLSRSRKTVKYFLEKLDTPWISEIKFPAKDLHVIREAKKVHYSICKNLSLRLNNKMASWLMRFDLANIPGIPHICIVAHIKKVKSNIFAHWIFWPLSRVVFAKKTSKILWSKFYLLFLKMLFAIWATEITLLEANILPTLGFNIKNLEENVHT